MNRWPVVVCVCSTAAVAAITGCSSSVTPQVSAVDNVPVGTALVAEDPAGDAIAMHEPGPKVTDAVDIRRVEATRTKDGQLRVVITASHVEGTARRDGIEIYDVNVIMGALPQFRVVGPVHGGISIFDSHGSSGHVVRVPHGVTVDPKAGTVTFLVPFDAIGNLPSVTLSVEADVISSDDGTILVDDIATFPLDKGI